MSTVVVINQFLSGYDTPLTGFCTNLHPYAAMGGARNEERVGVCRPVPWLAQIVLPD